MALKLASDERIIRNYEYATSSVGKGRKSSSSKKSLTITNKRIIHTQGGVGKNSEQISQQEVPISQVDSVETTYAKQKYPRYLIWGIVCLIVGLVLLIRWFSDGAGSYVLPIIAILAVGAGIALVVVYTKKGSYVLSCVIGTIGEGLTPLLAFSTESVGLNSGKSPRRRRKKSRKLKVMVSVDNEVVLTLAEELGAVILDAQQGIVSSSIEKQNANPIVKPNMYPAR